MEGEEVEGEGKGSGWKVRRWRVRGQGSGWKVRRWKVRGYEVVTVGRLLMLKITHTIFALMRRYSLPVSLPPLLTFSLGYLLLCCHSNSSTAEYRQMVRKMVALLMTVTQTSSSRDCWKWKETISEEWSKFSEGVHVLQ